MAIYHDQGVGILWKFEGTPWQVKDSTFILPFPAKISHAAFSPTGDSLIVAFTNASCGIWQRDNTWLSRGFIHSRSINSVDFTPDGKQIFTSSDDSTAYVWRVDGTLLQQLKGHSEKMEELIPMNILSFTEQGADSLIQLYVGCFQNGALDVWSANGALLYDEEKHDAAIFSLDYTPRSDLLATASEDHTISLWFWSTFRDKLKRLAKLGGHSLGVTDVAISPDGRYMVSVSKDRSVKIWDFKQHPIYTILGEGVMWDAEKVPSSFSS